MPSSTTVLLAALLLAGKMVDTDVRTQALERAGK